jgi:hypothetical protein
MESNQKNFKYMCENCNLFTNAKSTYDKHLTSGIHNTGKRAIRCDKKGLDKCPNCDYITKSNMGMEQHILNNHSNKKERKERFKYYCENCDFGTFRKNIYDNHLLLKKHIRMITE